MVVIQLASELHAPIVLSAQKMPAELKGTRSNSLIFVGYLGTVFTSDKLKARELSTPSYSPHVSLSGTGRRSCGGRSAAGKPDCGWSFASVSGGECCCREYCSSWR